MSSKLVNKFRAEAVLFFKFLEKEGVKVAGVQEDSGDKTTYHRNEGWTEKEIFDSLFACDDGLLYVLTPTQAKVSMPEERWIRFVLGNSWGELVSDWCAFDDMKFMDKWDDALNEMMHAQICNTSGMLKACIVAYDAMLMERSGAWNHTRSFRLLGEAIDRAEGKLP